MGRTNDMSDERRIRKRENERINRRTKTLLNKGIELGQLDGIEVALLICKYGHYTTFKTKGFVAREPSWTAIVS